MVSWFKNGAARSILLQSTQFNKTTNEYYKLCAIFVNSILALLNWQYRFNYLYIGSKALTSLHSSTLGNEGW